MREERIRGLGVLPRTWVTFSPQSFGQPGFSFRLDGLQLVNAALQCSWVHRSDGLPRRDSCPLGPCASVVDASVRRQEGVHHDGVHGAIVERAGRVVGVTVGYPEAQHEKTNVLLDSGVNECAVSALNLVAWVGLVHTQIKIKNPTQCLEGLIEKWHPLKTFLASVRMGMASPSRRVRESMITGVQLDPVTFDFVMNVWLDEMRSACSSFFMAWCS